MSTAICTNPFSAFGQSDETLRKIILNPNKSRQDRRTALTELECRADKAGYQRCQQHWKQQDLDKWRHEHPFICEA